MDKNKRYKVELIRTSKHTISVHAVDKEAAGIAAKEKFANGRLGQAMDRMEVNSVEEWYDKNGVEREC